MRKNVVIIVVCSIALAVSAFTVIENIFLSPVSPGNSTDGSSISWKMPTLDLEKYDPTTVIPEGFSPITEIPVKRAEEVTDEVTDDELVLGVEVQGEFRAYPINQLTGPDREIFNDELGETPIAATW